MWVTHTSNGFVATSCVSFRSKRSNLGTPLPIGCAARRPKRCRPSQSRGDSSRSTHRARRNGNDVPRFRPPCAVRRACRRHDGGWWRMPWICRRMEEEDADVPKMQRPCGGVSLPHRRPPPPPRAPLVVEVRAPCAGRDGAAEWRGEEEGGRRFAMPPMERR